MKKAFKTTLLALVCLLGGYACDSTKDTANEPAGKAKLITAEERTSNLNNLTVLKTKKQEGSKVRSVSAFAEGTGGYYLGFTDETFVKLYYATELRSATLENPIKAIDLSSSSLVKVTELDGSVIELPRVGTTAGATSVDQALAPESRFLLKQFIHNKIRLNTPAKSVEANTSGDIVDEENIVATYDPQGRCISIKQKSVRSSREGLLTLKWVGERLVLARQQEGGSTEEISLDYNSFAQLSAFKFGQNEGVIVYDNSNRMLSVDSKGASEMKATYFYDAQYRLIKEDFGGEEIVEYLEYNRQGDPTKVKRSFPSNEIYIETYTYEYDDHGNWIKRTFTSKSLSEPSVTTRKITY